MIELREVREADSEQLFRWRREPEVDHWMYEHPPDGFDIHRRWFDEFLADPDRAGFIVTRRSAPCGLLTLSGLTGTQRRAQLGWYIGEADARGRGAGRASQALGLDLAFSRYALQKVWSEVLADNDTALKAQAAAGFRREGYLRRHGYKNGEYRDVVLLAVLQEEWAARRTRVLKDLASSGLILDRLSQREREGPTP